MYNLKLNVSYLLFSVFITILMHLRLYNSLYSIEGDLEKHMVTVLDIQNKFIVFSAPMREVQAVLTEWGSFYVLGGDKRLYQLQEKDLQSKLALLFKKNLYDVSIR
jgi:hypothetical protein